ncbi:hypothetical protein DBW_0124 [Desulfuromonas sp. DDH964]|nr:hypothetical protein DBW_0124 [Desulfuromonas sp. DDH964]
MKKILLLKLVVLLLVTVTLAGCPRPPGLWHHNGGHGNGHQGK